MLFFFLTNLFWVGLVLVGVVLVFSQPYLSVESYKPGSARIVNRAYILAFFIMIYGWSILSMNLGIIRTWYETIGYIVLAMLIIGAYLENRRDFPLLRKEIIAELDELKKRDVEAYFEFYRSVESEGFSEALKKHKELFP